MNLNRDDAKHEWFARVDEKGCDVVAAHLPCAWCGYDIWGVPTAGQCPECGSAISTSLDAAVLGWRESDRLVFGSVGCAVGSALCIAFAVGASFSGAMLLVVLLALAAVWLFIVGWLTSAHYVATAPPFVLRTPGGWRIAMISRTMTILAVSGATLILGGIVAVMVAGALM